MNIIKKPKPRNGRAAIAAFGMIASLTALTVNQPKPAMSATETPLARAYNICAKVQSAIKTLPATDQLHPPMLEPTVDAATGNVSCVVNLKDGFTFVVHAGDKPEAVSAEIALHTPATAHNPAAPQPVN